MRCGKKRNKGFLRLINFVLVFLALCNCALSVACQTDDERFDTLLERCVELGHKNPNDGVTCLEKAIKSNPDRGIVYLFLADIYRRQKQLEKAEQAISYFIRLYPKQASGYESYCRILEEKGDLVKAQENCVNAVVMERENGSYWVTMASVQEKLGKFSMAESSYNQALAINPNDSNALFFLGKLYENQEDLDKAIQTLEKLLALKPNYSDDIEIKLKALKEQKELKQKNQSEEKKSKTKMSKK